MVHGQGEDVTVGIGDPPGPHERTAVEREGLIGEGDQTLGQRPTGRVDRLDRHREVARRHDPLEQVGRAGRTEHRPQHLVPAENDGQGRGERVRLQRTVSLHSEAQVVDAGARHEFLQQPQRLFLAGGRGTRDDRFPEVGRRGDVSSHDARNSACSRST
jgi:hypothetical protein